MWCKKKKKSWKLPSKSFDSLKSLCQKMWCKKKQKVENIPLKMFHCLKMTVSKNVTKKKAKIEKLTCKNLGFCEIHSVKKCHEKKSKNWKTNLQKSWILWKSQPKNVTKKKTNHAKDVDVLAGILQSAPQRKFLHGGWVITWLPNKLQQNPTYNYIIIFTSQNAVFCKKKLPILHAALVDFNAGWCVVYNCFGAAESSRNWLNVGALSGRLLLPKDNAGIEWKWHDMPFISRNAARLRWGAFAVCLEHFPPFSLFHWLIRHFMPFFQFRAQYGHYLLYFGGLWRSDERAGRKSQEDDWTRLETTRM